MREKNNLKMGLMSCVEQIGFVFFTILVIVGGIIFYPYILWCSFTSRPHHEESGYDN
jgi:hypothetical protein